MMVKKKNKSDKGSSKFSTKKSEPKKSDNEPVKKAEFKKAEELSSKKKSKVKKNPFAKIKRKGDQNEFVSQSFEFRLNRFIAHCGICSRRQADDLIKNGLITINGKVVDTVGTMVTPKDEVIYNGKVIKPQTLEYILLNKPKGYLSTTSDDRGRKTVMELIKHLTNQPLYPVGRLDFQTTGLLLLTNDGELKQKLTHPSFGVEKFYQVEIDQPLQEKDAKAILKGLELDDGLAMVDALDMVEGSERMKWIMEIHIGKNRIIRRIFAHLGYEVVALDRIRFAGLSKTKLSRGRARKLSEKEVIFLKHFSK